MSDNECPECPLSAAEAEERSDNEVGRPWQWLCEEAEGHTGHHSALDLTILWDDEGRVYDIRQP